MGVVVVIDPGHGGENLGGNTDEFIEKELTMKVANYMKERLQQYDDVEVHLTHESIDEEDLGREERAAIAKEYNADFLFSIHFNMSESHTLYGSEVWTSAFGDYYKKGQEFAAIEMQGLTDELGFFDRGIKTRIGSDGDDYYGIILYSKKEGIPAVIIEHCHMDEDRDADYLRNKGEDAYKTFGYLDADSVAKYFHLKSSSLGVDYSGYSYASVSAPAEPVAPDLTAPEYCNVELVSADTEAGTAQVKISAADNETYVQYVSLSYDGGETFDKVYPWNNDKNALRPSGDASITVEVPLKQGVSTQLVAKAYNKYDRQTNSDILTLPAMEKEEESVVTDESASSELGDGSVLMSADGSDGSADTARISEGETDGSGTYTEVNIPIKDEVSAGSYNGLTVLVLVILGMVIITAGYGIYIRERRRKKRRKRRRNSVRNDSSRADGRRYDSARRDGSAGHRGSNRLR